MAIKVDLSVSTKGKLPNKDMGKGIDRALKKAIDRAKTTLKRRITRLETNDLKDSPAYKQYIQSDAIKFSVRGKTTQELQSAYYELKRLEELKTGTVKGANSVLKDMARNTHLTFKTLGELKTKAKIFFDMASMAEEYLESEGKVAESMNYRKIWELVADNVKKNKDILNIAKRKAGEISEKELKELTESWFREFKKALENEFR